MISEDTDLDATPAEPERQKRESDVTYESVLGTQPSIVTIFSMWNTMMGTSLLTMPWAIKQAGFATGISLLLAMTAIMAYTSSRIITSERLAKGVVVFEFTDVVRVHLGKAAEVMTLLFSLVTIMGPTIVYWILMSNFLYHIVIFIYGHAHPHSHSYRNESLPSYIGDIHFDDVMCKNESDGGFILPSSFADVWDQTLSVPLFLVILVFPLVSFKSPTFFTKVNSFGVISVLYLLVLIAVKAGKWGIHVDMDPDHSAMSDYISNFEWTFPALTGIAAMAFFIHSGIMTLTRYQKYPENNMRDLFIAYCLVCFTYTFVGTVFYTSFPLAKSCIADNLLDNLTSNDVMAFVARVFLFFMMICLVPFFFFTFRCQLFQFVFGDIWPSAKHVVALNIIITVICVLFAMFLPNIGLIIRFVGAFCGMTYAIALPCLVYMVGSYRQGTLPLFKIVFHIILIAIGVATFISQFSI